MDKMFKRNLRDVYEQKNYQTLLDFRDEILRKWAEENVVGNTEFETIKLALSREYKKMGVLDFFNELEKEISQDA